MTNLPPNGLDTARRRRWRTALALALLALAVRLAVLAATLGLAASVGEGAVDPGDVARLHDGREYLLLARALGSPEELAELPPVARRLSPGYPVLVRAASAVLPPPVAALALSMLSAALATVLVYLLGVPARGAALFAVLTPSWVAFSSTAMSEGPFVALALLGLLAWRRSGWDPGDGPRPDAAPRVAPAAPRPAGRQARKPSGDGSGGGGAGVPPGLPGELMAGLLFGAAALVRPVGAVLFAALWLLRLVGGPGRPVGGSRSGRQAPLGKSPSHSASHPAPRGTWRRRWTGAAVSAVGFAVVPGLGWLASASLAGPGTQVRTYLRHDLAPPLSSLLAGFAAPFADPLKTVQNLAVLALVGTAAVLLLRRWRRGAPAAEWLAWLSSQALFYLLLPSAWVFECLARFLVPALPAVAVALAPHLPRCRWRFGVLLVPVTLLGAGVALLWNLRALGVME